MPEYEIMLIVENAVTYTIEAESQDEAIDEAREMFSPMDVDSSGWDITSVLVEDANRPSHFVQP